MISWQKLEPLILACAVAISRFAFRSHDLYDLDSVNFALAMEHFDPRIYQPHPPGYFLYVCLGRLFNLIVHDANLALVLLSIAASCGVILIIYKMTLLWFGPREARFASLLFLCSPLAWFHGTVALTYSVEAFFSALLGYLCWRIDSGNTILIAPAGVILGISAGVRPSSLLFLGPLYLFSVRNAKLNRKLIGVAALVLTLAAWIWPMILASGGFVAYSGALFSLWRLVPAKNTVFNSSPATSIARACTIGFIYLLGFGAASFALVQGLRHRVLADPKKTLFTTVWIAPAVCFFTFVFLQFVNSGYLLLMAARLHLARFLGI
jgi:4-amino-4-deoxy-L-arabinose transferase-like glycosyltransferase